MNKTLHIKEAIYFGLFRLTTISVIAFLGYILILLFSIGGSVINSRFLTAFWQHRDITQGGIFPAILGSIYLGVGVTLISFPLGIGTALYMTEYSKSGFWQRIIQLAIRNLAGVPSVIYGLFGLAVFAQFFRLGASLLSAILTLSAMTIPWIVTTSVESLRSVPQPFRESSFALGATKWQTIYRVVLPAALPGSITGGVIGIARAMGETAPLILVGATFYLSRLPTSPLDQFMALPYHTFILATQHSSPFARSYAAATALVLILLTFVLSLGAILLRLYLRARRDW